MDKHPPSQDPRRRLPPQEVPDPFSITASEPVREASLPRLFLREPGWIVCIKVGSDRMYCHLVNPGEDAYHRLSDGEIYLLRGDERICIPCADRHGLLHSAPKGLRPSVQPPEFSGLASIDTEDYPLLEG